MPHGRRGFSKKIDSVHWTVTPAFAFNNLGAGTAANTLLNAQHLPETLLRIRGEWAAAMVGPLTPDTGVNIAAGIILVPEGTGTTVLWSPFTDGDAPWIWWDTFSLFYAEYVTDVVATVPLASRSRVIDSKAMRKVRNQEVQLVVENTTSGGQTAASLEVMGLARILAGA